MTTDTEPYSVFDADAFEAHKRALSYGNFHKSDFYKIRMLTPSEVTALLLKDVTVHKLLDGEY